MWHNFNGNINRFCRSILEILSDGLQLESFEPCQHRPQPVLALSSSNQSNSMFKLSSSTSTRSNSTHVSSTEDLTSGQKSMWTFLVYLFNEEFNNENNAPVAEFRTICEQLLNRQRIMESINYDQQLSAQNQVTDSTMDWIFASLRQHKLHVQLQAFANSRHLLGRYYARNAFLMNDSFFNDFLIYIRAFETEDHTLISEVRNVGVNFMIEEQRSNRSSRVDLTDIGTGSRLLSVNHESSKIKHHRRIHSFPNIQINLLKKNETGLLGNNNSAVNSITSSLHSGNINDTTLFENSDQSLSHDGSDNNNKSNSFSEQHRMNQSHSSSASVPKFTLNNEPIEISDSKGNFSQIFIFIIFLSVKL